MDETDPDYLLYLQGSISFVEWQRRKDAKEQKVRISSYAAFKKSQAGDCERYLGLIRLVTGLFIDTDHS